MAYTNIYDSDQQNGNSQANPLSVQKGNNPANQQDKQDQSQQNTAAAGTATPPPSASSVATDNGSTQVRPTKLAAGTGTSSGAFTDINKYVEAQGPGPKLGQKAEDSIAQNVQKAQAGIGSEQEAQTSAIPKAKAFDPNSVTDISTGKAGQGSDEYNNLLGTINQRYTGPDTANFSTDVQNQVQNIKAVSQAAATPGNQSTVLQTAFGGQRNTGIDKLDSALLNNDANSKQNLNNIAGFGSTVDSRLADATKAVQDSIAQTKAQFGENSSQAKAAVAAAQADLDNRMKAAQQEQVQKWKDQADQIASGNGDISYITKALGPDLTKRIMDAAAATNDNPKNVLAPMKVLQEVGGKILANSGGAPVNEFSVDPNLTANYNNLSSLVNGPTGTYVAPTEFSSTVDAGKVNAANQAANVPVYDKNSPEWQQARIDTFNKATAQFNNMSDNDLAHTFVPDSQDASGTHGHNVNIARLDDGKYYVMPEGGLFGTNENPRPLTPEDLGIGNGAGIGVNFNPSMEQTLQQQAQRAASQTFLNKLLGIG